jgi:hypothetical protein
MRPAALVLPLLLVACRRDPAPPAAAPATPPTVVAPSPPSPLAPADPRRLRDLLRPESRRELDAATVPLLLPRDERMVAVAVVTAGPRWVAASIPLADLTVSIHGNANRHEPPPGEVLRHASTLRGVPATVSRNELIRVATWEENGVAWSLEVECSNRPDLDARCVQEDYLRALAASLVEVRP